MNKKILLSHAHLDSKIATLLSNLIEKLSLGQIKVWFSSDERPIGGIEAGEVWFDAIRKNLKNSCMILCLLTPQSITRPWIYFEAGFGTAAQDIEVIPVAYGFNDINSIPLPLSLYQIFQINDKTSLCKFLGKMFARYELVFDEELAYKPLSTFFGALNQINLEKKVQPPSRNEIPEKGWQHLIDHFDKRFFELTAKMSPKDTFSNYTVPFQINIDSIDSIIPLQIDLQTSVQDIIDNIWFIISRHIEPLTYLEKWILIENKTNRHLIVKEFMSYIPAKSIFRIGSEWKCIRLQEPYTAAQSRERLNQYYKNKEGL